MWKDAAREQSAVWGATSDPGVNRTYSVLRCSVVRRSGELGEYAREVRMREVEDMAKRRGRIRSAQAAGTNPRNDHKALGAGLSFL